MKPKDTEKLLELLKQSGSIDSYLKENSDFLIDCDIKEFLNALINEKHMTKTQVFEAADFHNKFVGFQILDSNNPRKPSREQLLSIAVAMHLNLDETQTALKIAKYAPLYPKDERDSIIIFGIEKSQSLMDINEALYDHDFKCLCEK
jgi:hypothetical protein